MPQHAAITAGETLVGALARFFPDAMPVRIPVQILRQGAAPGEVGEDTVVEFGTSRELFFVSRQALDFEETVRVKSTDGSLNATASVVAMQLAQGKSAVAVRFAQEVTNWIVKPVASTKVKL